MAATLSNGGTNDTNGADEHSALGKFAALTMSKDLGLTPAMFGLGAGIFFIGYFLFEVPSNLILHRFGARRWIDRVMITWGIISTCFTLIHGAVAFYVGSAQRTVFR
jgi:hypothetical protein